MASPSTSPSARPSSPAPVPALSSLSLSPRTHRIQPPSSIPRLPSLSPSPEHNDRLKDFNLDQVRKSFDVSAPWLCVRVPARESGAVLKAKEMNDAILHLPRISPVAADGEDVSSRLIRLAAQHKEHLPSAALSYLESKGYPLVESSIQVGWDFFSADQILGALLPEELAHGSPTAFTITGHIMHINMREEYLPYRHVIGKVLLEKNPGTRTIVNKLEGIDNQFRFFDMELLAGEADYVAETSESDCTFRFDFRTVYWNSRLHAEHWRLISCFPAHSVLFDVMAGVGPFAIPSAKRFVWTYANDLNPSSHSSLVDNARRNKVEEEIQCFCMDGREFIRTSVKRTWKDGKEGPYKDGRILKRKSAKERAKEERARRSAVKEAKESGRKLDGPEPLMQASTSVATPPGPPPPGPGDGERLRPRKLVDHYVMNLPGSAIEFLDAFRGIYKTLGEEVGERELREEIERRGEEDANANAKPGGKGDGNGNGEGKKKGHRPMVHVHTFTKHLEFPNEDVVERANAALGLLGHPSALKAPPSPSPDKRATSTPLSLSSARSPTSELSVEKREYLERLNRIRQERLDEVEKARKGGDGEAKEEGEGMEGLVKLHLVRAVAPNKDMYCLSFPIPDEVLWDL